TGLTVGSTLISGNKAGGNLFTLPEREYLFSREGFAFVAEFPFSDALKNTSAEEFLKELFARIPARAVFCGEDFRFGKDALGTPALLKVLAPCPVNVLPLLSDEGNKISVSGIKRLLSEGNVAAANLLLCGGFFWQGTVMHGRQVGRTYGFPTLNVRYPEDKFPLRDGVYGGYAETPAGKFPAILNAGARPTFGLKEKMTETFLKGFDGDLYGATVRIYPTEFLRPIQKFSSRAELESQLRRDIRRI
ncbi:MAG: hypothetical protein K2H43_05745, partial [Clostridia bacterium]|nr:hypothetical protein [Clostridia bacterium]